MAAAGFCDPKHDAGIEDMKLWVPSQDLSPANMDRDTAEWILENLSGQFYTIYRQEQEAQSIHLSQVNSSSHCFNRRKQVDKILK